MHYRFELICTAFTAAQIPQLDAPQAVLAGRSNVGKSSLINTLAGRKALAKTSATPGKTQSLNFYKVEPAGYYLVDLPGYGYARSSKTDREKWARLIEGYLKSGPRCAALLVDSRLQTQESDLATLAYLQSLKVPTIVVLTKADKCKQTDRGRQRNQWRQLSGLEPVFFSSRTGEGRELMLERLGQLLSEPDSE